MNRYILEEQQIGEGSFGSVYRATRKGDSGQKYYAVKKLKETYSSWRFVCTRREVQAIVAFMSVKNDIDNNDKEEEEICDDNINHLVRVFEILREQDSCLYFVMEYMEDGNLQDLIESKSESRTSAIVDTSQKKNIIEESDIKSILNQTFKGLSRIHDLGYVHRDIKPENILIHRKTVKLGDFSLARPVKVEGNCSCHGATGTRTRQQQDYTKTMMTDYVGTRWYRAPELLISRLSNNDHKDIDTVDNNDHCSYTEAIDIFAMGLVAAELYRCFPLFRGRDNTEQLQLIKDLLLVEPFSSSIGYSNGNERFFEQNENDVIVDRLARVIPANNSQAIVFIRDLLYLHPERRPSTRDALRKAYFSEQRSQDNKRQYQPQNQLRQNRDYVPTTNIVGAQRSTTVGLIESAAEKIFPSRKSHHEQYRKLSPLTPRGLFPNDISKKKEIITMTGQYDDKHCGKQHVEGLMVRTVIAKTQASVRQPLASSVRITPDAGVTSPISINGKRQWMGTSSSSSIAQVWQRDEDLKIMNDDISQSMTQTSFSKRNRPKIRASQIFNID